MGKQLLLAIAGPLFLVGVFLLGFVKRTRTTRTFGLASLALGVAGLAAYIYFESIAPNLIDQEKETARKAIFDKTGKYPDTIELKMKWPPRTSNIRDFHGVARVGDETWNVWVVRKDVGGESRYWCVLTRPGEIEVEPGSSDEPNEEPPATTPTSEPTTRNGV